jgi:DNA-binding transcriptional regulator PaaX
VDAAVGDAGKTRWLILIYRLPREPSRHRVAVWRKLKTLGAIYLQDGAAVLPEDAVTREQLEWLQLRIREAGGEATLWEALPNIVAEDKSLVEEFRASREAAYKRLIEAADRLRRKAALGSDKALLLEELGKMEREFRAERRRDYFRSPLRNEAAVVLREVRQVLKSGVEEERSGKAEGS